MGEANRTPDPNLGKGRRHQKRNKVGRLLPICFRKFAVPRTSKLAKLTKRTVDAAAPRSKDYFVWCGGTSGFGVRIHPSGKKVFAAQVRVGRATRRLKIGQYSPFTVDQARSAAEEIIRTASSGVDPQRAKRDARDALTVFELCDQYMEQARAGLVITRFRQPKRKSTVAIDDGRVTRHIKPLIGPIAVRDLDRVDVQRMADQIAQGRTKGTHKGKKWGKAVVKGGAGTAARNGELFAEPAARLARCTA